MNRTRQRLDRYERGVAYLLVATFLCLGFLSWWGRKEPTIRSAECVYQGQVLDKQEKAKKLPGKCVKSEKKKKKGRPLVKKETV